MIPKAMLFGKEEGEAIRLEIRKVEFRDERNKEEREELETVRKFLKRIKWQNLEKNEEEQRKSGITWIEMFALYMCKGAGAEDRQKEKDKPLEKNTSLQSANSAFNTRAEG